MSIVRHCDACGRRIPDKEPPVYAGIGLLRTGTYHAHCAPEVVRFLRRIGAEGVEEVRVAVARTAVKR